jgi:preprotein translocase subunit SecF
VRLYRKKELDIIIDESINATLSRTLQTAITTLLALFALYLFGGTALQGFSFALIWGVVIGQFVMCVKE